MTLVVLNSSFDRYLWSPYYVLGAAHMELMH